VHVALLLVRRMQLRLLANHITVTSLRLHLTGC
jgi:hypothetical protein